MQLSGHELSETLQRRRDPVFDLIKAVADHAQRAAFYPANTALKTKQITTALLIV